MREVLLTTGDSVVLSIDPTLRGATAQAAGVIVAVARPPKPTLGPQFTADRAQVVQTADSMLRCCLRVPRER
mgnify:CR=1 FL=1